MQTNKETQMVNLGELFRKAKKGQKIQRIPTKKLNTNKKIKPQKRTLRQSGIFGLAKIKNRGNKTTPAFYRYTYHKDNGKKATVQRTTLMKLYEVVQDMGYDFVVSNKDKAKYFINNECNNDTERDFFLNKIL